MKNPESLIVFRINLCVTSYSFL